MDVNTLAIYWAVITLLIWILLGMLIREIRRIRHLTNYLNSRISLNAGLQSTEAIITKEDIAALEKRLDDLNSTVECLVKSHGELVASKIQLEEDIRELYETNAQLSEKLTEVAESLPVG